MNTHRWISASALMALAALQASVCNAEPRIGTTASARPNADAVSGENIRALSAGSEIYANQTVRTGNRGKADLVFIDSTNLGVGPSSEVRLDKFVYDPRGSSGSVVMEATRGAFRFVTGTQAKEAYKVNTPQGALGVHGTRVEVAVNPRARLENECATKVRLLEGEVNFTVAKTKKVARLTEPNGCFCISPKGEITYSVCTQPLGAFAEDAGPPPSTVIPGTGPGTNPVSVPVVSGSIPF